MKLSTKRTPRARLIDNFKTFKVVQFCAGWTGNLEVKRRVVTVNTVGVRMSHPFKNGESYLDFPKASEVTEPSPGLFYVNSTGFTNNQLEYRFEVDK